MRGQGSGAESSGRKRQMGLGLPTSSLSGSNPRGSSSSVLTESGRASDTGKPLDERAKQMNRVRETLRESVILPVSAASSGALSDFRKMSGSESNPKKMKEHGVLRIHCSPQLLDYDHDHLFGGSQRAIKRVGKRKGEGTLLDHRLCKRMREREKDNDWE